MDRYIVANTDNTKFLEWNEYNYEFEISNFPTFFDSLDEANEAITDAIEALTEFKPESNVLLVNQIKDFLVKEATIAIN